MRCNERKGVHRIANGCESGRQDSNLRPLVPQTTTYLYAYRRVQK
jgi:hypothetical protein